MKKKRNHLSYECKQALSDGIFRLFMSIFILLCLMIQLHVLLPYNDLPIYLNILRITLFVLTSVTFIVVFTISVHTIVIGIKKIKHT